MSAFPLKRLDTELRLFSRLDDRLEEAYRRDYSNFVSVVDGESAARHDDEAVENMKLFVNWSEVPELQQRGRRAVERAVERKEKL